MEHHDGRQAEFHSHQSWTRTKGGLRYSMTTREYYP